ncbi:RNA-binding motif protein 42 [Aphelenchoides fujianensis]|nr:RNA-binding motif protein 42 [Aphelenchoides fujianensis]
MSGLPRAPQPPGSIISSAPVLYSKPGSSKSTGASDAGASYMAGPAAPSGTFKTMALPSDVELMQARKQANKAHENSYLGQVLRGEKKMKRFVRTGGGQTWEDRTLAEWDPNDFRIFCGDLGNEVSDELLAKAFRKYPSFQKAKVVRDGRTNKPKGYGFVLVQDSRGEALLSPSVHSNLSSFQDFVRACREMDGKYVGNRPIKLRKSNWKDRNLDVVRKKNKQKQKLGLI